MRKIYDVCNLNCVAVCVQCLKMFHCYYTGIIFFFAFCYSIFGKL